MNTAYHLSTVTLLALAIGSVPLTVNTDSVINSSTTSATSIDSITVVANATSQKLNFLKFPTAIEQLLIKPKGSELRNGVEKSSKKTPGEDKKKSVVSVIEKGIKMAHEFIESSGVRNGQPDVAVEDRGSSQLQFENILENLGPSIGQGKDLDNVDEFKGDNSVIGTFVDEILKPNKSKLNNEDSNSQLVNVDNSNVVSSVMTSQTQKTYIHVGADIQVLIRFLSATFGPNSYLVDIALRLQEITDIITRAFAVDCSPVVRGVQKLLDITVCIFAGNPESAIEQLDVFIETQYTVLFRQVITFFNIPERTAVDFVGKIKQILSLVSSLFGGKNNILDILKFVNGGIGGDRTGGQGGKDNPLDELGAGRWTSTTTSGVLRSSEATGDQWRQDASSSGAVDHGFTKGSQWETTASSDVGYSRQTTRNQDIGGGTVGDDRGSTGSGWSGLTTDQQWTRGLDGVDNWRWTTHGPALTDDHSGGVFGAAGSTDNLSAGRTSIGVDEYRVTTTPANLLSTRETTGSQWSTGGHTNGVTNEGTMDSYWTTSGHSNGVSNGAGIIGTTGSQDLDTYSNHVGSGMKTTSSQWVGVADGRDKITDDDMNSYWTKFISYWTGDVSTRDHSIDGRITTSAGTDEYYSNEMEITGTTAGNIGINTGNMGTTIGSMGTSSGNMVTSTGSMSTSTGSMATSTGSVGTSTGSIGTSTGSMVTSTGSMGTITGSMGTSTGSMGTSNGNTGTSTGSMGTSTRSMGTSTGSIGTSTGSMGTSIGSLGTSTGSMETSTGSMGTNTGNMGTSNGNTGTSTGSMGTSTGSMGTTTGSMRTSTGIIVTSTESKGTSIGSMGTSTGSMGTHSGSMGTSTGSIGTSNGSIGTSTGSIVTSTGSMGTITGSMGTTTGSMGTSIGSLGTSTGSMETNTGSMGTSTGSMGTSNGNTGTSTGSMGTSTRSMGTSTGSIGTSTESRGTSTGRMGTTSGNMGTTSGSMETASGIMGTSTGSMGTTSGNMGTTSGSMETTSGSMVTSTGSMGTSTGSMGTSIGSMGTTTGSMGTTTGSMGTSNGITGTSSKGMGTSTGSIGRSTGNMGDALWTTEGHGSFSGSSNGMEGVDKTTGNSWQQGHNSNTASFTTPIYVDGRVAENNDPINTNNSPKSTGFVVFVLKIQKIVQLVQNLLSGNKNLVETALLGKELLDRLTPLFNLDEKTALVRNCLDFLDRALCVLRRTPLDFIKRDFTKIGQESRIVSDSVRSLLRLPPSQAGLRDFMGQAQQLFNRISCLLDDWNSEFPFQESTDFQQ